VIREAAGAADAGDHHKILAGHAQLRENGLHGGEDGVIAAPRAPAHLLIGLEILFGEWRKSSRRHRASWRPSNSSIFCSSSFCLKGRPWILFKPTASTRYFARKTQTSCPMLSS